MFLLHRVEILVLCWAHHKPLYSVELAVYRNCGVKNCVEWETFTVFDHILINTTFAHGSVNSHLDARRRKESEDLILCCHLWAASRTMQRSGSFSSCSSFCPAVPSVNVCTVHIIGVKGAFMSTPCTWSCHITYLHWFILYIAFRLSWRPVYFIYNGFITSLFRAWFLEPWMGFVREINRHKIFISYNCIEYKWKKERNSQILDYDPSIWGQWKSQQLSATPFWICVLFSVLLVPQPHPKQGPEHAAINPCFY